MNVNDSGVYTKDSDITSKETGIYLQNPLHNSMVVNKMDPNSGSNNVSYNIDNNKYIHPSLIRGKVVTNKIVPESGSSNVECNIDNNKYIISNKLSGSHKTNKTVPNSGSSRIECEIDRKKYVKDIANISHTVSKRGIDRHKYIHSDVKLESSRPEVSHTVTNKVENIYKNPYSNSHNRYSNMTRNLPLSSIEGRLQGPSVCGTGGSRTFNLKPKIKVGGMEGVANKPLNSRLL